MASFPPSRRVWSFQPVKGSLRRYAPLTGLHSKTKKRQINTRVKGACECPNRELNVYS